MLVLALSTILAACGGSDSNEKESSKEEGSSGGDSVSLDGDADNFLYTLLDELNIGSNNYMYFKK